MSLLAELKRRNVIRMAGLYLVGAWLIAQVSETLLPIFHTPDWVLQTIVVALAIGFVPALALAWIFEFTPEGIKRDAEVDRAHALPSQTAQRMNRLIVAGLLLALTYFGVDKFVLAPKREAALVLATTHATRQAVVAATATESALARGVAVLPFENLSPDPDNAFFAGGVFEEVLTKLSKVPELRVISRTSMEQIATQGLEVSAIGKRLGVSHVLEGSVRRAGDKVRVTVQLIEAGTDNHVWAENYDRQLDDVFAIQSEIALAIADQLKITLSPKLQSNLNDRPTKSPAAYDLYLRAVEERRNWRGAEGFRTIIGLLEPAVATDPDFLEARVQLANAYGRMFWLGEDPDGRYVSQARAMVAEIQRRWPDRPESVVAQGQLLYNVDRDYEAALQKFRSVQESLPGELAVVTGISSSLKRLRRAGEFLVAARRWQQIDPESIAVQTEMLFALNANHLYDEALAFAEQAVAKFPDDEPLAYRFAAQRLSQSGDIEAMLDYGRRFASTPSDGDGRVAIARFVMGDVVGALEAYERHQNDNPILNALSDADRADLLKLVGREAEGQALAARTLAVVREAIATDRPAPRGMQASWYVTAASVAALAGDRNTALAWKQKADVMPVSEALEQLAIDDALADFHRFMGDSEAAWRSLAKTAAAFTGLRNAELLAFKPYYDKLYGESPSYRAYVAGISRKP